MALYQTMQTLIPANINESTVVYKLYGRPDGKNNIT